MTKKHPLSTIFDSFAHIRTILGKILSLFLLLMKRYLNWTIQEFRTSNSGYIKDDMDLSTKENNTYNSCLMKSVL